MVSGPNVNENRKDLNPMMLLIKAAEMQNERKRSQCVTGLKKALLLKKHHRCSRRTSASFPDKLRHALSHHCNFSRIIRWSTSGKSFLISNLKKFLIIVLPQLSETLNNFPSFQRRLIRWGFAQLEGGKECLFYHKLFQRDRPELSTNMNCTRSSLNHATVGYHKEIESLDDMSVDKRGQIAQRWNTNVPQLSRNLEQCLQKKEGCNMSLQLPWTQSSINVIQAAIDTAQRGGCLE